MKRILLISISLMLTFCITSCTNNTDSFEELDNSYEQQADSKLSLALKEIISNTEKGEKSNFIIYNNENDSYEVFTEYEYYFSKTLASIAFGDGDDFEENVGKQKAPKGKDWTSGGSGKGYSGLISVGRKISKKIPKEQDFELYVEYQEDGSFKVWYRLVDNKEKK